MGASERACRRRMGADEVLEEASEYGLKGVGPMQSAHQKRLRA